MSACKIREQKNDLRIASLQIEDDFVLLLLPQLRVSLNLLQCLEQFSDTMFHSLTELTLAERSLLLRVSTVTILHKNKLLYIGNARIIKCCFSFHCFSFSQNKRDSLRISTFHIHENFVPIKITDTGNTILKNVNFSHDLYSCMNISFLSKKTNNT